MTRRHYCCVLLALLISACATAPPNKQTNWHYAVSTSDTLLTQHAPIISVENGKAAFNRPGEVIARVDENGNEAVLVSPDAAVFYAHQETFTGQNGRYTNLIYRLHFPYVPQPHLTAGKNGGLFIITTLNEQQQPVLITTVHTCGCYLAFFPTQYLPTHHLPDGWNNQQQRVYGETLPGQINYPANMGNTERLQIQLRNATHRVADISSENTNILDSKTIIIKPLSQLTKLPLGKGHTSFFDEGGYVKQATKPWERLLMSWWVWDWHIGNDKQLVPEAKTGAVFYTSLKPWARRESNLADFPRFLNYWGWRL